MIVWLPFASVVECKKYPSMTKQALFEVLPALEDIPSGHASHVDALAAAKNPIGHKVWTPLMHILPAAQSSISKSCPGCKLLPDLHSEINLTPSDLSTEHSFRLPSVPLPTYLPSVKLYPLLQISLMYSPSFDCIHLYINKS